MPEIATDRCGITKEMWTVVLDNDGSWLPTDIFSNSPAAAQSTLDLINKNHPNPTITEGAKVTRCIVSIYPPS
jgi:hypothetical protein